MQVRNLSPNTQHAYIDNVARFARHFGRSPADLGPEEIRRYQVAPGPRTPPGPQFARDRGLRPPVSVHGHPAEAVVHRRRDPGPEETATAPGRAQPRGSRPLPRVRSGPQAPRDPDHLLRGRVARLGSGPSASHRS
ncbi:MAG: phage integrase N-terminal SAM-like domain-containing protein [Candidatus Moduliflexus flocculans]|nr:phage integrase N-terminal SAM-like domain-containing protein [Candidatus Moduliflexus flocculans]